MNVFGSESAPEALLRAVHHGVTRAKGGEQDAAIQTQPVPDARAFNPAVTQELQIVLQTAPHIGNTGMNGEDPESRRIWVAGYIVRDPSRVVSNWRADESLWSVWALESAERLGWSG